MEQKRNILKRAVSNVVGGVTDRGRAFMARHRGEQAAKGLKAVRYLREYRKEGSPTDSIMESEARGDKTSWLGAGAAKTNLKDVVSTLGIKGDISASLGEKKKKV